MILGVLMTKRIATDRNQYRRKPAAPGSEQRRLTYYDVLRKALSKESRRLFTMWRAAEIWDAAYARSHGQDVRWDAAEISEASLKVVFARLVREGRIRPYEGDPRLYYLVEDWSEDGSASFSEGEILAEIHPRAVRVYSSAVEVLGLTNRLVTNRHFSFSSVVSARRYLNRPSVSEPRARPQTILDIPIVWHDESPERLAFASERYLPAGGPQVLVATLERCLVDALYQPKYFGGWDDVLEIWENGHFLADVDVIVAYCLTLPTKVIRQRVGLMCERVGLKHPDFERWAEDAKPGGRIVLYTGDGSYGVRDERWKLGINAALPDWV